MTADRVEWALPDCFDGKPSAWGWCHPASGTHLVDYDADAYDCRIPRTGELIMTAPFTARDVMARKLITVTPETDAFVAIDLLLKHRISGMPVLDATGTLVGILSERDCLKTLTDAQYHNMPTHPVRDLMTTELTTISADTGLLEVAKLFMQNKFRRLPVLDEDGRLIGQLSRRDVLTAVQKMHKADGPAADK
jgi:CBS domain-containing protein